MRRVMPIKGKGLKMSLRARVLFASLAAAALAAGCAGKPERPTAEMTRAQTLIEQAEQQGAQQFAGADLEQAREKLRRADDAADDGDTEVARRLAMEATLDAELANVKTNSGKAQKAAAELDQSVESLRREAARGNTTSQQ